MALFDKEFNQYREKNDSFLNTWMASNLNDMAKWALIFGILILLSQVESLIKKIYYTLNSRLDFILNWKFELLVFVLDILSLIPTFILISFAIKFKKAFKEGDETACIRLIALLKSFFIWMTILVFSGFCSQGILRIFTK